MLSKIVLSHTENRRTFAPHSEQKASIAYCPKPPIRDHRKPSHLTHRQGEPGPERSIGRSARLSHPLSLPRCPRRKENALSSSTTSPAPHSNRITLASTPAASPRRRNPFRKRHYLIATSLHPSQPRKIQNVFGREIATTYCFAEVSWVLGVEAHA